MKVISLVTSSLSRPVENWGFGFTQLIEDNEASKLAELEAISDTSSNLELMDEVIF
jgi:hypothetical protein